MIFNMIMLNRRLGGESNREIVSFRFVRSCVRARGVDVRWMQNEKRNVAAFPFPFSPCGIPLFPCVSLFSLCSSSWVKWDQQQTIATM